MVKAIITKDQKIKQAMEYVSKVLLYDSFARLKAVVATSSKRDSSIEMLIGLDAYIKKHLKNTYQLVGLPILISL